MRNRLILVMVGVVALILAVHDIPLARHLERVERDRLVTGYERDAFIIGGQAEDDLTVAEDDGADLSGVAAVVDAYALERGVEVVITDSTGQAVVASDSTKIGSDLTNRPEVRDALATRIPQVGQRFSNTLDQDLFFVTVPVLSGPEAVGAVRISGPSATVAQRVNAQIRGLALVAVISLLIATFVAWVVANGFTRPLEALRRTTDRLADGDLSARAARHEGPPEVDAMAKSFNTMANQIQQLVDRQRDFAGIASHQLRTPLTALRLQLESLEGRLEANDPAAQTVADAGAEVDRLRRMIEGLLLLGRGENATLGTEVVRVDEIVTERAEFWEPLAAERNVTITMSSIDSAEATVLRGSLRQVIDNLVDNALEVAPAGSAVNLAVIADNKHVEVRITDAGPGLSDEERKMAFDRFWRSSDAVPGGTGLGLTIVDHLVTASGGSCELERAATGGIEAVVRLEQP